MQVFCHNVMGFDQNGYHIAQKFDSYEWLIIRQNFSLQSFL